MDNQNPMRGLRRGSQMTPEELQQLIQQKQVDPSKYEGMSDELWQKAQEKLNEVLAKQPQQLIEAEPMYNDVSADELQKEFDKGITPEDLAKKRALQKMGR